MPGDAEKKVFVTKALSPWELVTATQYCKYMASVSQSIHSFDSSDFF